MKKSESALIADGNVKCWRPFEKHRVTYGTIILPSRYTLKRNKNIGPCQTLYMDVHNNIIHNSQIMKKKKTKTPTGLSDEWMNNGTLFRIKMNDILISGTK